jgi:hypothetical protein
MFYMLKKLISNSCLKQWVKSDLTQYAYTPRKAGTVSQLQPRLVVICTLSCVNQPSPPHPPPSGIIKRIIAWQTGPGEPFACASSHVVPGRAEQSVLRRWAGQARWNVCCNIYITIPVLILTPWGQPNWTWRVTKSWWRSACLVLPSNQWLFTWSHSRTAHKIGVWHQCGTTLESTSSSLSIRLI